LQELSIVLFSMFGAMLIFTVNLVFWSFPFFMLLGWYYPSIWLRDLIKKRHHAMSRALPYNLDLLTLAVEAGLDFAQAVGKVVEKGRQGPLVEEFRLVLRNLRLGKTREDALRGMAERVQLASLTSFSSALIQADRMGTSLGKILRLQATQLRIDRTHRAEKLANEAPVKMLFPLIACIFPTVFMVLFGPIIYQFITGK
jgi:tight adherence protein C